MFDYLFRRTTAAAAVALLLVVGAAWLMGPDLGPWFRVAKESAKDRMTRLVNKYRFELEKAKTAVADARDKAEQLKGSHATNAVAIRAVEKDLAQAQRAIDDAHAQLSLMESRLASGQAVRLVSG